MKKILLIILCGIFAFAACDKEEDHNPQPPVPEKKKRTVIAYITGDNNISSLLTEDVAEMQVGAKKLSRDCNLIAFVDAVNNIPYIAEITRDSIHIVKRWKNEFYATDPDSMLSVYKWIISNYPAEEYATMVGGHGSGAIISKDTLSNKFFSFNAYGYDNKGAGNSSMATWINIPTLAKVFNQLPHMEFIFMDCCCMACIELVYELRKCTDYVIAPTSETPAKGAPYNTIVPLLSLDKSVIGDSIIKHYIKDSNFNGAGGLCIAAVKTSGLDTLMNETHKILKKLYDNQITKYPEELKLIVDKAHCIYYYRDASTRNYNILHDMKSIFHHAMAENVISKDDFENWVKVFNNVVVAKYKPNSKLSEIWITDRFYGPDINFEIFRDYFTDEDYGALSMIIPSKEYDEAMSYGYLSINKTMFQLEWCNAVGWHQFGW